MARKLKSDRVLFLTTILLVGLSIVIQKEQHLPASGSQSGVDVAAEAAITPQRQRPHRGIAIAQGDRRPCLRPVVDQEDLDGRIVQGQQRIQAGGHGVGVQSSTRK